MNHSTKITYCRRPYSFFSPSHGAFVLCPSFEARGARPNGSHLTDRVRRWRIVKRSDDKSLIHQRPECPHVLGNDIAESFTRLADLVQKLGTFYFPPSTGHALSFKEWLNGWNRYRFIIAMQLPLKTFTFFAFYSCTVINLFVSPLFNKHT